MRILSASNSKKVFQALLLGFLALTVTSPTFAQLQLTEFMNNPSGPGDNIWEWVEVRNLDPNNAVDLKGYLGVNLGDNAFDPNATFVDATVFGDFGSGPVTNTIIPAGGVGIIYDGFDFTFGSENFDPNGFYEAWGLDPNTTTVMPANFWPGLSNSGTGNGKTIAFYAPDPNFNSTLDGIRVADRWPSYLADTADTNPDPNITDIEVVQFTNAAFSVDYRDPNTFPTAGQGQSVHYIGTGDITAGSNWALSSDGDASGAYTSSSVVAEGTTVLNSTDDLGNPGTVPGGPAPTGLIITEILYNPAGAEDDWEWVEVLNNTGSAIDFGGDPNVSTDGYVIDDSNSSFQSGDNISGTCADGEVCILYNADDVSEADFLTAWDPNGAGLTLLAVTSWNNMGLNNSNDTVGIWANADYVTDTDPNTGTIVFTNAAASQEYGTTGYPDEGQGQSIFLGDVSLAGSDPNNWVGSVLADFAGSANAAPVIDPNGSFYHEGGDVGSPGTFIVQSPGIPGDFDNNGRVDAADFLAWQRNPALGDLADWEANYGTPATSAATAVPEPASLLLAFGALTSLGLQRRRQG